VGISRLLKGTPRAVPDTSSSTAWSSLQLELEGREKEKRGEGDGDSSPGSTSAPPLLHGRLRGERREIGEKRDDTLGVTTMPLIRFCGPTHVQVWSSGKGERAYAARP
jgi:hypothetical protein